MVNKLTNSIGKHNKVATLIIVVVLIITSYIYRHITHSSLADNLYAGAIEVAITVLLIQAVLDAEHKHRLKLVNAHGADATRIMTATFVFQLLSAFGYKLENGLEAIQKTTNSELRTIYRNFTRSEQFKDYLQQLTVMKPTTKRELNKLVKLTTEWSESLNKDMRNIKPYPKPELVEITTHMSAESIALKYAIDELYTKIVDAVVKKHKKGSKEYKESKGIVEWLWGEFIIGNVKSDHGLAHSLNGIIDKVFTIHKAAEDNALYLDT